MDSFRAIVVNKTEDSFSVDLRELTKEDLPPGEVTIRVAYSGVNFKDGMASLPNGRILRKYPMVPGIDLAGTVVQSDDPRFHEGQEVLITGYDLGVSHFGGFSELARVPADWVVPLPAGLSARESMIYGTAGFTAALSIHRLEQNGLAPDQGPVIVTGSTGGVGSTAVAMLAKRGYQVIASTGKETEHDYLKQLGAKEIVSREEVNQADDRSLLKEKWAGAVDPVGGSTLSYLLKTMKVGGSVALSGLTGGNKILTTVYPFILRGVSILGVDSVNCPMPLRQHLWDRLAGDWKPNHLEQLVADEVGLEDLFGVFERILKGQIRGRVLVKL